MMMRRKGVDLLPEPGDPKSMYVFDLSGFVWRTFRAPGQAPHAAVGFARLIRKTLRDRRPGVVAIARDNPHPTFRHGLLADHRDSLGLPGYKEERQSKIDPAEKARGLEQCRRAEDIMTDAFGLACHAIHGFEGDDIVATFVQMGINAGMKVVIVAHDKDLLQLVTTDSDDVVAWDSKYAVLDACGVEKRFGAGCFPDRVTDYQAIVGDKDEVPGIPGCGEVAALQIINAFPSLEDALATAESGEHAVFEGNKGTKLRGNLVANQQVARLSKKLATLVRDVPVHTDMDRLKADTAAAVELVLADAEAQAASEEINDDDALDG